MSSALYRRRGKWTRISSQDFRIGKKIQLVTSLSSWTRYDWFQFEENVSTILPSKKVTTGAGSFHFLIHFMSALYRIGWYLFICVFIEKKHSFHTIDYSNLWVWGRWESSRTRMINWMFVLVMKPSMEEWRTFMFSRTLSCMIKRKTDVASMQWVAVLTQLAILNGEPHYPVQYRTFNLWV